MKAYERLNVEVVKFEAQDVITASVACTCSSDTAQEHNYWDPQGTGTVLIDHTRGNNPCYAEEHDPNCRLIN